MQTKITKLIRCHLLSVPIGDCAQISGVALDLLNKINYIFCETANFLKSLPDFNLNHKQIIEMKNFVAEKELLPIVEDLLLCGQDFALVSDSGLPGFCDPGGKIIEYILNKYSKQVKFVPLGFSSALDGAICILGSYCSSGFIFAGDFALQNRQFHQAEFDKHLETFTGSKLPLIFYVNFFNLAALFAQLQNSRLRNNYYLLANLSKQEIYNQAAPTYRLSSGDLINITKELSAVGKRDDIVLVLLNK